MIFGVIEALTPLAGWSLGKAAAQYFSAWDHWITFTLQFVLGARAVFNRVIAKEVEEKKAATHAFWLLSLSCWS
jgi:manganese efflux pump family protein